MQRSTRLRRIVVAATVATVAGLLSAPPVAADSEPKIIAGRVAQPAEFPYQVSIGDASVSDPLDAHLCGGSIIAPEWVLTAAHCLGGGLSVTVGTNRLDDGSGSTIAVTTTVGHPQYDDETLHNDIALLRLAEPVDIPPVALHDPSQPALTSAGTIATLSGWGGISPDEENQVNPPDLRAVDFPIVADQTCQDEAGPSYDPAGGNFCAGDPDPEGGGPDACRGDSGGPLVVTSGGERVQVGIVSGGPTCGQTLSTYTRVSAYRAFITSTTGADPGGRTFSDTAGNLHEDNIEAVADAGIAGGFPDGTFRPDSSVTRGQMATFLSRSLDLAAVAPTPFSDAVGNTHEGAIGAVAAAGIAGGFPDGTYRPDAPVTRGQMATFLARARNLEPSTSTPFSDVAGTTHAGAIGAVAAAGIAGGFPDGTYRPDVAVTRGQMATFLARSFLAS